VSFLRPELLLGLLGLPLLLALAMWAAGRAQSRREQLLGALADALAPGFTRLRRIARDGLALVGTGLVVLALAGPLYGTWMKEVQQRGVDVMIVLDSSRSMLAEDVRPSRLERAKREVRGLLSRLAGHRVGLVTFAGDARSVCPLTHDASTVRLFLDDVDTASNATGGTAIGEGLETALDAFDDEYPAESVILLLTDGEDHDSDPAPDQIAYEALARGVPIHVVAFGTAQGGAVPIPNPRGGATELRGADGEVVITRPDENLLEQISGISQGSFLSAARTPFPLDEIFDKRIAVMEGVTRASSVREEGIDRFQWALALAILCLGLAHGLRDGSMGA
jgi:Ca-activated chloride channel family protein